MLSKSTYLLLLFPLLSAQSAHNFYSPNIELPSIGDGETMHFGFYLHADMPDSDGDGDDYLDDYYRIAFRDLANVAWHSSDYDPTSGNIFWCADNESSGYMDGWLQYLDTPPILVGNEGKFSSRIYYAIESPDGVEVEDSCADGWDSANIRISIDGGSTWVLLEDPDNPYHFDCGYGWIWNNGQYDTGGSLNHLAKGWGGLINDNEWATFSADLSEYAGEDIIIRFAFGSDPAWSTSDDNTLTGFKVDDILVEDDTGELFSDSGEDLSQMAVSGAMWKDQFYDFGSDNRPGASGWTFYSPGMPFAPSGVETNVYLDISKFADEIVQFRIQTQYDNNDDGGQGSGLFIDDFWIYKIFSGTYIAPSNLTAKYASGEVVLEWDDMNLSDTEDFIYDNDAFDYENGIRYPGWVGKNFDILGNGTINSVSIYNINEIDTAISFGVFSKTGALIDLNLL